MARSVLIREEIEFLATKMYEGNSWADSVTAFNLAYPDVDAVFLAGCEAEITAIAALKTSNFTPNALALAQADIDYLDDYLIPSITSSAALTTTGKLDTVTDTPFEVIGEGFALNAAVTVDGAPATSIVVESSRKRITAKAPAHAAGAVDVVVTNPNTQTDTDVGGIEYAILAPNHTSHRPEEGPAYGGTVVVIEGSDFQPGATVTFDATPATEVVVHSPTLITCKAPAHAAGAVGITIANPNTSTVVVAAAFTYA